MSAAFCIAHLSVHYGIVITPAGASGIWYTVTIYSCIRLSISLGAQHFVLFLIGAQNLFSFLLGSQNLFCYVSLKDPMVLKNRLVLSRFVQE